MGALDGTLATPFGTVSKKTAAIVGGGAILIFGIVWWRSKKQDEEAAVAAAGESEINPATGYPYGSAEDAAAMAAQADYILPTGAGGGGGASAIPPGGVTGGYATNGQWAQAAVQYMTANGLIEDATQLSAALGKYITGQPTEVPQRSLIEQAIAFQGYPPIAGSNGYPPAINTGNPIPPPVTMPPPTTTPPTTTPPTAKPPRRFVMTTYYRTNNPPWNSTLSGIVRHIAGKGISRSVGQIASWNGITNVDVIQPNRQYWIDPPGSYSGTLRIT